MCECIIQSQDNADLYLDYLQTQISKAGNTCPYEYVLLESKKDLNQSSIDKEMEICGRRHIGNKWFSGSVRLTYASGGPMRRNGLVAKFTGTLFLLLALAFHELAYRLRRLFLGIKYSIGLV